MGDIDELPAAKKRKVTSSRIERPRGVAPQFRQTDTSDVHEVCMYDVQLFMYPLGRR